MMEYIDGFAGLAALVNSLLLWPVIRSLKKLAEDHGARLTRLERRPVEAHHRGPIRNRRSPK